MQTLNFGSSPREGTAPASYSTKPTANDPYRYQAGFGNRFLSEALPDVIPEGQNTPQHVKYDLYSEQLNGAAVVTARKEIRHVWMYRVRPSVAHGDMRPCTELNDNASIFIVPYTIIYFLSPNLLTSCHLDRVLLSLDESKSRIQPCPAGMGSFSSFGSAQRHICLRRQARQLYPRNPHHWR